MTGIICRQVWTTLHLAEIYRIYHVKMIFGRNIQEYRNIMRPKYRATPSLGERRNIEWRKYGKCAQTTRQAMTHIASLACRWEFAPNPVFASFTLQKEQWRRCHYLEVYHFLVNHSLDMVYSHHTDLVVVVGGKTFKRWYGKPSKFKERRGNPKKFGKVAWFYL